MSFFHFAHTFLFNLLLFEIIAYTKAYIYIRLFVYYSIAHAQLNSITEIIKECFPFVWWCNCGMYVSILVYYLILVQNWIIVFDMD